MPDKRCESETMRSLSNHDGEGMPETVFDVTAQQAHLPAAAGGFGSDFNSDSLNLSCWSLSYSILCAVDVGYGRLGMGRHRQYVNERCTKQILR